MSDTEHDQTQRIVLSRSPRDTGRILGAMARGISVILLPVFVCGLINAVTFGIGFRSLLLLLGPPASMGALLLYGLSMYQRRRWLGTAMAFSGLIPYLFGLYLFGVEGFGRLLSLFGQFSLAALLAGLLWLLIGWAFVRKLWQYTEIVKTAHQTRKRQDVPSSLLH